MKADPESGAIGSVEESVRQFSEAAAAKKCWQCGCLHNSLTAVERAFPNGSAPSELEAALSAARQPLVTVKYDCLGCEVCYPALAINALNQAGHAIEPDACANEPVEERDGWPPLPGAYTVLRYQAPVAVCTLTDEELAERIARDAGESIAIVGSLHTENLGIERLMANVVANPHIRFLILCGADTQKAVGHLPGQSLMALSRHGISARSRIVEARGRRPVLRNVAPEAVEHFRRNVEIVDLMGTSDVSVILEHATTWAERHPGPAEAFDPGTVVLPTPGSLPERMVPDPAGYFVVYVDNKRQILSLEHYRNNGALDTVIEGRTAAELYSPVVQRALISRLDHAAYLGRELARAEQALRTDEPYVQDAAPERQSPGATSCGCEASCGE